MQKAVDTAPAQKCSTPGSPRFPEKWVCAYLTHALPLFADDEYCGPGVKKESQFFPSVTTAGTSCLSRLYQQEFNGP
jgi:hypothetical protein